MQGLHTVWLREHNRVCGVISSSKAYKKLDDEAKFDLTRRVVEAKMQQIVATEWLPLLGITVADIQNAKPDTDKIDVSAEFFTVFRFGAPLSKLVT